MEKIKNKPRKFTEVQESSIKVLKLTNTWVDEDGRVHRQAKWETITEPINLGSSTHPNREILEVKINSPDEVKNPFNMFFKGLGR